MTELLQVRHLPDMSGDSHSELPSYTNPAFSNTENGIPKSPTTKSFSPTASQAYSTAPTRTKLNVWKNLIFISVGFFFLFAAFSALANIQSSLNPDQGLGTVCLAVIYAALVVSCMFVPSVMLRRLGCKWTLVLMPLFYSIYMGANFKATWGSLIPTSIGVGFAAAPLWSAKCTYLTQIGTEYAALIGEDSEVIIVRFFGYFFMSFQSGQIIGNIISSVVLDQGSNNTISEERLEKCGASYCNEDLNVMNHVNVSNSTSPDDDHMHKVTVLCGIYLGCALFASLLMFVFVDRLERSSESNNSQKLSGRQLLVATFSHMRNPKQILIIPLTIFSGIEQGFFTGDFTKAFVTCPLGIDKVGFVLVCYGCVDAICSPAFGPIVKKFGRIPLYLLGAAANIAVSVTLLKWHPDPDQYYVFFVLSGLWGMADAIWQTQINAFYGVIFTNNEEAAFSNYRLWESVGFILAFAYSNYLCINQKLYILLAILSAGILGYLTIEVISRKHSREEKDKK